MHYHVVFPWRIGLTAGLLLGSSFVVRASWDIALPVDDLSVRARTLTWVALAICAVAGYLAARRTGFAWTGAATGAVASLVGGFVGLVGAVGMTLLLAGAYPADSPAARALAEALDVPIPVVFVVGSVIGLLGGVIGRLAGGGDRVADHAHGSRGA